MAQPLEFEQVGYNAPDGMQMGRTSSDTIGFYGTSPVTRYALVGAASTYIVSTSVISGLDTAAAVTSLVFQVSTMTVALRNLGLDRKSVV